MKTYLIILIMFFSLALYSQNNKSSSINDVRYNINLIKFYYEKGEFENALEFIDQTLEESINQDTLYYFKAIIYEDKEDWLKASEFYAKSILASNNTEFISDHLKDFENVIERVSPLLAFDIISTAVTTEIKKQKRIGFLNILARLYEENQLYDEANDVYSTILPELTGDQKIELKLKIITNSIFQKEYQQALDIIGPLIELDDSLYKERLLFLDYIANISLENYEKAKDSLLELYMYYPDNPNRSEILLGLVDIFRIEKQYIMCWFILDELNDISNDVQKFKLQNELDQIRNLIYENPKLTNQFKYLKPVFDIDSIKVKMVIPINNLLTH
ncbi:MAG: hypothetical protein K9N07_01840 [Candidatus Cloacimonetes bacterium]|nr:hypothetical protein [Candidatus Cloacimonadota bacterium]